MSMPAKGRLPEFERALAVAEHDPTAPQPKCASRDPELYTGEQRPSRSEARLLCEGRKPSEQCAVFELCKKSALHEKPKWGVHAGIVWDNGRQLHLRRKKSDESVDLAA